MPSATTRTWMPELLLEDRENVTNSPDCSVEVVDATVMKRCASTLGVSANASARSAIRDDSLASAPWQFSLDEGRSFRRRRLREKALDGRALHQAAGDDEQDLVAQAACLAKVVRSSSRSSCRLHGSDRRSSRPRGSRSDRDWQWARRGIAPPGVVPTRGRARAFAARRRIGRAQDGALRLADPRRRALRARAGCAPCARLRQA